ncbi:MAG: acyltransferase domain-containing protein [Actinobacteria bacterium]|jgi:[acyl-carrier-protein] S-malonyltransferase|uniref:[acyl-carrier-protein] S-malonyltransferase n=1 Tax=freshwater metagenome TaxID=449393 RepID=A0A6J6GZG4_9ZZZZ|nr:acyltransferase domain-containing protein [Actinomycetota bacterium]MTA29909.1 acyltransferase domain-containing protein [Actinomycetota bacterium]
MLVIVCPGQGSQTPGFFTPWLEIPAFKESIELASTASGLDLTTFGTISDADTIRDTAIAQPLIVSASLASFAALQAAGLEKVGGVAGHSVGELAAAAMAGVFDTATAMQLVTKRGSEMADAAAVSKSSMAAVLGGDRDEVVAHLVSLGLTPANYNGAGQIVAAGSIDAIAKLIETPLTGTRVIPLQVAGAFHTNFMEPAVAELANFAAGIQTGDPSISLWTNKDGTVVSSGVEYLNFLVSQVSNPVRWDLCMDAMVAAGVTALIEVSPAGTLAGLAKRGMPGVETLALKTPDQIDAAIELAKNHG